MITDKPVRARARALVFAKIMLLFMLALVMMLACSLSFSVISGKDFGIQTDNFDATIRHAPRPFLKRPDSMVLDLSVAPVSGRSCTGLSLPLGNVYLNLMQCTTKH
jgi:hypothetical protein